MNKLIRELAEESGLYHRLASGSPYPSALSAEECEDAYKEFAYLIIKECIQAAGPEDSFRNEWFHAKSNSVKKIKQRFEIMDENVRPKKREV